MAVGPAGAPDRAQAAAGAQAPCVAHPGNPAAGVCERCGDFMCRLCTTYVEGRLYCPKCFDLLYNRGSLHFTQRQFTLPGTSLGLGIAAFLAGITGLFLCTIPFSLLLGIGGIAVGIRALRDHRERPDLPNRPLTLWGIGLSAASLIACAAWTAFWIWTFARRP